jgi:CheY-like chemotaxis protein
MPGMDGLEATRRIRRLPTRRSTVPILGLTASVSKEDRDCCIEAGMSDFLTKPLSLEALRAALKRCG